MIKRLKKLIGTYTFHKILIVPYRSYGTYFRLYVKGRVLDNPLLEMDAKHSIIQTFRNAFRQFDTHEIPNVNVVLRIAGLTLNTITDRKGYFLLDAILPENIALHSDMEGWVEFEVHLDQGVNVITDVFKGEFLIPEKEADYGIISDIDDTILNTGVTSFFKWKVLRNSLFVNAYKRIPLAGAAELYRQFHLGVDHKEKNPVFYLSNSPWNMYQYLKLFLDHSGFPKGPILLRSFNSMFHRVTQSEKPHKQKEIINLLMSYPELKFILIGDSGEHDASIYTEIAAQFPNRILCIYLRTVRHRGKMQHVKSIVDNFRNTPVLLVETSEDAAVHAKANGYI